MKKLAVLLLLLASSSVYAEMKINDPLQYSMGVAQEFSRGDSGDEGVYDCRYQTAEQLEVGGNVQIIACEGQRKVLVFGGHWATADFECHLNFEPTPMGSDGWQVTYEDCQ